MKLPESRLTFVKFDHFREYKRRDGYTQNIPYDLYKCACGKAKVICRRHVARGTTISCGCLQREIQLRNVTNRVPFKKGHKTNVGRKNKTSPTKDKIFIRNGPTGNETIANNRRYYTGYYVTKGRADAIFWGLDGEVESLRIREAPNKGTKLKIVNGKRTYIGKNETT